MKKCSHSHSLVLTWMQQLKNAIEHGERVREVLKQAQYAPRDVIDQIITLFALENGFVKNVKVEKVREYMDGLVEVCCCT